MIYYFTPYSTEKNLGKYYNDCMAMIPSGSWACFTDGDSMFTTADFGHHLERIIAAKDNYKLFTCMTNRVGTKYQCVDGMFNIDEMSLHRDVGRMMSESFARDEVRDITFAPPLSGVLMLLNKDAWSNSDKFKESGMLGVDNSIHYSIRNSSYKVGLMTGVYVQHYYRFNSNPNDTKHLQ